MKYRIPISLALSYLLLSTACQSPDGNQTNLWNWWKQDAAPANKESESEETSDNAVPAPDEDNQEPVDPTTTAPAPDTSEEPADDIDVTPPPTAPDDSTPESEHQQSRTNQDKTTHPASPLHVINPPSLNAIRSDVLRVNDETISVNDILEPLTPRLEQMAATLSPETYYRQTAHIVRQQILEAVAQHLIWRRAKATITEDMETRLDKVVDKMEKDRIDREFHGLETLYNNFLTKHDRTRTEVREHLRRSVVVESYLRDKLLPLVPAPTKRQLKNYYDEHKKDYAKPALREMFLIDLPVTAFLENPEKRPSESELAEAHEKAATAAGQAEAAIKAGKTFEEVAKEYSKGVNADRGGNWGSIELPLRGRWAKPSKRLFEMDAGQVSEIIETANSFFIVKVGNAPDPIVRSFHDAQTEIANILKQHQLANLRADFLQQELDKSTLGSLDDFVSEILRAAPQPNAMQTPTPESH